MEPPYYGLYKDAGLWICDLQLVPARRQIRSSLCMPCGSSLQLTAVSQVVIGTKSGELQVFDIATSTMTESIQAHGGAVWSLHVRPDSKALVTGSADKDIKFWEFEQLNENVCAPH
jgi:U3 small nucleolar RNA-associated protein 12